MKTWERMNAIVKSSVKTQGVKQKFLAEKCGYDEKTFSFLINGRKPITDIAIEKFCTGMNVTPNDIVRLELQPTA